MKEIEVKKGEIIQRKGDLNSKIYAIKKGLIRTYSIDKKGKEHVFMFAPEGWIVADAAAVNGPSELYIEALEDSIIQAMNADSEIAKASPVVLMKRIAILQKRSLMLLSASAIERYEDFLETYPDIVQRVPQKMIASYLGITPEALSKVKGESIKSRKKLS